MGSEMCIRDRSNICQRFERGHSPTESFRSLGAPTRLVDNIRRPGSVRRRLSDAPSQPQEARVRGSNSVRFRIHVEQPHLPEASRQCLPQPDAGAARGTLRSRRVTGGVSAFVGRRGLQHIGRGTGFLAAGLALVGGRATSLAPGSLTMCSGDSRGAAQDSLRARLSRAATARGGCAHTSRVNARSTSDWLGLVLWNRCPSPADSMMLYGVMPSTAAI